MIHKTCPINYGHLADLQKFATDLNKKNLSFDKISPAFIFFLSFQSVLVSLLRWLYGSLIVGILYRLVWYDNKMLSSQWDNDNQHFVYIIVSWYLLGIITRQGFLFSCSCMIRCTCRSYEAVAWSTWFINSVEFGVFLCVTDVFDHQIHEYWMIVKIKLTSSHVLIDSY